MRGLRAWRSFSRTVETSCRAHQRSEVLLFRLVSFSPIDSRTYGSYNKEKHTCDIGETLILELSPPEKGEPI